MILMRRLTVLLLVAAITLGGCSKSPEQLFESAKTREAKGDLVGAIIDLKAAIQSKPDDASMRFLLGTLYNRTFDGTSAAKELQKANELGLVEGGRVMVELARALRADGKWQEIIKGIAPQPAFEPDSLAAIYALRGRAYHALGKVNEAVQSLEQGRAVAIDQTDLHLLEAQIKAGKGDIAGALKVVDDLLIRIPDQFDALTYRAELLRYQGKRAEAISAYEDVLKRNPNDFRALMGRFNLLLTSGRSAEAQKDLDVLIKQYRGFAPVRVAQGAMELVRGHPDVALESAVAVLKVRSDFSPALLLAGLAHQALRSPLQAEKFLTKYIAQNPGDLIERRSLVTTLLQLDQTARAVEVMAPIVRSDVTDPITMAIIGDVYIRVGDHAKGMSWLDKAAAAEPENPDIRFRRAITQLQGDQPDLAITSLESAAALTTGATPAHELLVLLHIARGQLSEAEKAVGALEKSAANSPITANLKGLVFLRKKEKSLAVAEFQKSLKLDAKFLPAAKNLAQIDLGEGNVAAARQRFESILAADPSNLGAMLNLSELAERFDKPGSSVAILERAVNAHPRLVEPRVRLARGYLLAGDLRSAHATSEQLLGSHPNDEQAIILAADLQVRTGSAHSAVQALSRLVQLYPKSEGPHFLLGHAQVRADRMADAEASFKKALEIKPTYGAAQAALVATLVRTKRMDEAVALARRIQKNQPASAAGLLLEGELLELQGKLADAIRLYERASKLQPASESVVRLFAALRRTGDAARATKELERWQEKHPNDVSVNLLLASALAEAGDFKQATQNYERVLELDPTATEARNGLAWGYFHLKDPRALVQAEIAYKLAPGSAFVADTLGWLLLQNGDLKRGLHLLRQAALSAPQHPEIRYHLAVALHKTGDLPAARKELVTLVDSKAEFSASKDARALLESLK